MNRVGFRAMWGDLLFDYTLRNVALGSSILGLVGGALGSFAVLRRQSLLGDAIAHAALPGIAIAYMITRSKAPIVLLAGAATAGWIGALTVMSIVRRSRIKYDSALGIVLSVYFGFGLVLLTFLQRGSDAGQSGLENFLFGQAAAIVADDVITMAVLGGGALLAMALFWKPFKLLSFDPDFGTSLGFSARRADVILTTCLVIAIVIGLQAVGVVLMSAMIVAPGAAARQWTDRLGTMVLLAGAFGALAGVTGALFSARVDNVPAGPAIVIAASTIVIVSLLLAPNRGVLWASVRRARDRRRLRVRAVVADLNRLAEAHADPDHAHPVETLRAMNPHGETVRPSLEALERAGHARSHDGDGWTITPQGRSAARDARDGTTSEPER